MLPAGELLHSPVHGSVVVGELLGSGGQGDVYEVSTEAGPRALKWYFPSAATSEQRAIIERASSVDLRDDRLLWPEALVEKSATEFGYIMRLRPDTYVPLSKVINGRATVSTRHLLRAGVRLVGAFRTIQSNGLTYRDIKDPNVFVDPASGDVLVCDNDNAVPDGYYSAIKGTTDFCAPELLVSDARPGRMTDLHSMAVLLFMMMNRNHPLDGAAERRIHNLDEAAREWLYGKNPMFIFDPSDDSNRPVSPDHDHVVKNWALWPAQLRALWTETFTDGLREPQKRPSYREWEAALAMAHDRLFRCAECSAPCFLEGNAAVGVTGGECSACGRPSRPPLHATIGRHVVALGPGAAMFPHHLSPTYVSESYDSPLFSVVEHPTSAGVLGVRNLAEAPVAVSAPGGPMSMLEPGQTVALKPGLSIRSGGAMIDVGENA